ncbi:MAG: proteasome accessory factor PafA2 family protein [Verrucomicrobiales bacterium]|nr:proteasome accessory factor PafA2 family protein [Verrucomicrobiales bacterium]
MIRVVGLETEYGCLSEDPAGPASTVGLVRNWLFENRRYGLPDVFQRDWDEPPGNGGFLFNGGRAYVDMGHLEYCTPECLKLRDLILYDRVGDTLVNEAIAGLGLGGRCGFVRNNVDHFSGATFGCHENYLVRRSASLSEANVLSLLAFLTLRVLYTGAGRVGSSLGSENRGDHLRAGADLHFQISQRADYINNELFEWVQFNRAIINTRDEPLADARRFRRLHLLHGDTSVLPCTLALKAGTTALVLDLLEINRLPSIALADAVATFRLLSHRTSGPWPVTLADGASANAVELLGRYLDLARSEFRGRDRETDDLLNLWTETLTALAEDPDALVGRVDWITKRWLFRQFVEREGIEWNDPWLRSQDLEFHHVLPERSLGLALDRTPEPWRIDPSETAGAKVLPPVDSRANARSTLMVHARQPGRRYFVDWEVVDLEGYETIHLQDPFDANPPSLRPVVPAPAPET